MTVDSELIKTLAALGAVVVSVLEFFRYQGRRDKLQAIRENFDKVVARLKSTNDIEKAAGAVLLRRFFDSTTEGGTAAHPWLADMLRRLTGSRDEIDAGRTPYAREAIGVIASMLRMSPSSTVQKMLADGLAYAPSLQGIDLQRTNLRNAYLGSRQRTVGKTGSIVRIDLSDADLFRAELSNASLKNVIADRTVFYQARMHHTVLAGARLHTADFREADLRGADFRGADLQGVRLDGAILDGANFQGSFNLPQELAANLQGSRWRGKEPFRSAVASTLPPEPKVFLAKPGSMDYRQRHLVEMFSSWTTGWGFIAESLERDEYPERGAVEELSRRIGQSHGLVVFGFAELEVHDAFWRPGTPDARRITEKFTTPWCQIEAGMAAAYAIPVLVIPEDDVKTGIFGPNLRDEFVYVIKPEEGPGAPILLDWCEAVRKRAALY